jgi:hypothetical protein
MHTIPGVAAEPPLSQEEWSTFCLICHVAQYNFCDVKPRNRLRPYFCYFYDLRLILSYISRTIPAGISCMPFPAVITPIGDLVAS